MKNAKNASKKVTYVSVGKYAKKGIDPGSGVVEVSNPNRERKPSSVILSAHYERFGMTSCDGDVVLDKAEVLKLGIALVSLSQRMSD